MYEERNRKIKEHGKATRERHCQMDCRVFSVKIQENRTSKAKLEKLNRCFLEAKWLRNAVVATVLRLNLWVKSIVYGKCMLIFLKQVLELK